MPTKPGDKLASLVKRLSKLLDSNPHLIPYLHPLTLLSQRRRLFNFNPRKLFTPKFIRRTIYFTSFSAFIYYTSDDLSKYFEAAVRVSRTTTTALSIVIDYRQTLYNTAYLNQSLYEVAKRDCHQRSANKLLHLISTNRGIYVKLGQHITSLDHVLPNEYCNTMKQMYSMAPQSTKKEVEQVFEEEMQKKWGRKIKVEDVFDEWNWIPLGTASLAQVHKAKLKKSGIGFLDGNIFEASDGYVAVKIQHANVLRHSSLDILTVKHLVDLVQWVYPEVQLGWLADEMATNLPKEMNFVQEAENAEKLSAFIASNRNCNKIGGKYFVHVPAVWWPCTTPRILVMELISNASTVTDVPFLRRHKINTEQVASAIGALYADMIFKYGFVHCDPHPGNIFVQLVTNDKERINKDMNWRLVLLDHGLYKELSKEFRSSYAKMWMTLLNKGHNEEAIKEASDALGGGASHRLLSSILTHRSWRNLGGKDGNALFNNKNVVNNGTVKGSLWRVTKRQVHDIELLRTRAALYFTSITQLLSRLPRELLLLLKTNDLLMAIERTLVEEGSVAPSIMQMSLACGELLSKEALWKIHNNKGTYWRLEVIKVKMEQLWLRCKIWVLSAMPIWFLNLML